MQALLLISSLVVIAVGSCVATRLLALAQRTGRQPEQLIGTSLASFAMVAYPLLLLFAFAGASLDPVTTRILRAASATAYCATLGCLVAFVWSVFRSRSRWAGRAAWSLLALAASGAIAVVVRFDPGTGAATTDRLGSSLLTLAFTLAFAWASGESLRQWLRLRRRERLDLADPTESWRFLILGLGNGAGAAIALALVSFAARGLGIGEHPAPGLLQCASGLALSATWLLTFAPPRRYRVWLGGAAARDASA